MKGPIKDLVERLDNLYKISKASSPYATTFEVNASGEWPRLRDSILVMYECLDRYAKDGHYLAEIVIKTVDSKNE